MCRIKQPKFQLFRMPFLKFLETPQATSAWKAPATPQSWKELFCFKGLKRLAMQLSVEWLPMNRNSQAAKKDSDILQSDDWTND